MRASNESPVAPVDEIDSLATNRWEVLLRVPCMGSLEDTSSVTKATEVQDEPAAVQRDPPPADPPQVSTPSEYDGNRMISVPSKLSIPFSWQDAQDKTLDTVKKFAGNLRYVGTLGTIAVAIFACTLVVRAMKQDRVMEGSVANMAFREPPRDLAKPDPTDGVPLEAVSPDFDPATLANQAANNSPPTETTGDREWDLEGLEPPRSNTLENATNVAAQPWASPAVDPPLSESHATASSTFLPREQPRPQTGQAESVTMPATPAAPADSFSSSKGGLDLSPPRALNSPSPFLHGVNPATQVEATPNQAPSTDLWPPLGHRTRQPRVSNRTEEETPRFVAQRQTPTYPNTSTSAYPSLQEWGESLYAQSERERQIRIGDNRGFQPAKPTGGNRSFSSEIVR